MTNLTDAEQKYLNHDWVNDKNWKLYLSNLYPSPSIHNIEKYKKKYFQKNIDKNFDINTKFQDNTKENKQQSTNYYPQTNNHNYYNEKTSIMTLLYFSYLLCTSLFYFILLALNIGLYKKIGTYISLSYLCAFIILLYLDYKIQKQNFSMVQFFASEKGQYLSYSFILFFVKDSVLIYLPVFLTILINSYLIYKQVKYSLPPEIQRNNYINKLVGYLDQSILNIYTMRASIEIYNLIFIIICIFLKRTSILNLFMYMHFFKLKYNSSDSYFHACYTKNGEIIRQFLSHPMVPRSFLNIFNKISHYFTTYLTYRRR
ncbi:hypothetical protein YYC_03257 [Plasmodium yoelii 17X]|uniref:TMEM33 domain-containing protein, putative n=2 Tax=Plasmodium yoelii TaxID=5861 RepID=A0A078KF18_PLAYE|nr:TMEM33 domain-containing protein, putative [Plasmodium yoelii]ETB59891.1 hypothetical protein YYC_03257 [Plasmodium yoelii 17X]CDU84887.1 conserved Plasmodium membrane protein, unknown function [Plasmodium yoelii]VTZ78783.1 TMEM33 domain-containing protein, putative [Plasmodium yoelii]|eukprot:XP_022813248.1 TMEM33 domain-containing protein, putative [Plasmodium yoelii]